MPELSTVLVLALLPGVGVAAGGLLAEVAPRSKAWLNWSLHAAAGIVIAIAASRCSPQPSTRFLAGPSASRERSADSPTWAHRRSWASAPKAPAGTG
jgi:hypothetical protein